MASGLPVVAPRIDRLAQLVADDLKLPLEYAWLPDRRGFVTTAVEQLTLILKQAEEQQLKVRVVSCGGSNSPDQLIEHAGAAANALQRGPAS